jgi:hypothetical protein
MKELEKCTGPRCEAVRNPETGFFNEHSMECSSHINDIAMGNIPSTLNAQETLELIRKTMLDTLNSASDTPRGRAFKLVVSALSRYERHKMENAIPPSKVTAEHAADDSLNNIGHKHGLTLNQVIGLNDSCDKINKDLLVGTGIVAVPFWFQEQYVDVLEINKQLVKESNSLNDTLRIIQSRPAVERAASVSNLNIPERKSIITGVTQVYIPGQTGPRLGDEKLDRDSVYIPPHHPV